ncbi:hypothetical protein MOO46_07540 (plasmid) [Apilactobacillus apisilvae]|uniref:Uncharacterized protein n=1 Tax=Apilactobacillus apisilvae TaxID=2923364 RepID=A0ABY4PJM5_9LACO|nr:hypothetical protein [Apilactobacillus apisilvae]UQS85777.1 hypothetical protein MOO46_07540 [Apilactobacillus apisilvae]
MASPLINGNVTDLSKNFNPKVWLNWVYDAVKQQNNFFKSGIITQNESLSNLLMQSGQGYVITIPHTMALDTSLEPQNWDNKTDLTVNSLDSYTENDIKTTEAQAFGNSDFDDYMTGARTLDQITSQFAAYWSAVDARKLIQLMNVLYLNDDIKTAKSFGIGNEKDFSATNFVKAMAHLGDKNQNNPTQMAVNSGAYNYMVAQNLIDFIQPNQAVEPIATYNGLSIVKDDKIPLTKDGKTTAYLFGANAVSYATATAPNGVATTRDDLHQGGITGISHKRVSSMHAIGTSADLTQVQDFSNWKEEFNKGEKALYKPVNKDSMSDINLVNYSFTIDKDFVIPGVNTTDTGSNNAAPKSNGNTPSK